MALGHCARARIVVVARDDAATLADCLDGVAAQDLDGIDVVVVDLDSSDGAADVAIRHPLPARVVVMPPGDLDGVVEAASMHLGPHPVVLLPASRRPVEGWIEAALAALDRAWVVLAPGSDLTHVALDRPRLGPLRLFDGIGDRDELARRVEAAGGGVTVAEGMRTVAACRRDGDTPGAALPTTLRRSRQVPRYEGLISVVVCTRDRPDQLARCLASISGLRDPCREVIVIDNHERQTVDDASLPAGVRVVHEAGRGLDVARNRGIAEARGEIVAYVDDDCEVDPLWIDGLRIAFCDPHVDAVTGRVRPASLGQPAQRWFESHYSFDRGTVAQRFTPWDNRPWYPLWTGGVGTGCNMAFRRSTLTAVGGFDEILDMGTSIGGGGDLDVFARLLDRGSVLHYTPDALVWHHHRATEAQAFRQFWGYGVSVGALVAKSIIERPGMRLVAVRFFLDRLRSGVRTVRHRRRGRSLLPVRLVLVDLAGQCAGAFIYLAARGRATARRA
jgi:glycosyltransferase involved in cell wall biosynthesis